MKFSCKDCDFHTCKTTNWERHLSTRKHILATDGHKMATKWPPMATEKEPRPFDGLFSCLICQKKYKHRKGLWTHNKKYHVDTDPDIDDTVTIDGNNYEHETIGSKKEPKQSSDDGPITPEMYIGLLKEKNDILLKHCETLKQNSELQTQLIELAKQQQVTNNTNCNNTNNFNLNVYLNETCKNAINYNDFLKSIVFNQEDFQKIIQRGYVNGHTLLIKEQFEKLDVHERPIQCSDPKRGVTHIKNDDTWKTEDENMTHIKKLTDTVTHKTMQQYCVWTSNNPAPSMPENIKIGSAYNSDDDIDVLQYRDEKDKHMELNLHVMKQVNGIGNEMDKNNREIHKNIIKMVTIDKEREKRR